MGFNKYFLKFIIILFGIKKRDNGEVDDSKIYNNTVIYLRKLLESGFCDETNIIIPTEGHQVPLIAIVMEPLAFMMLGDKVIGCHSYGGHEEIGNINFHFLQKIFRSSSLREKIQVPVLVNFFESLNPELHDKISSSFNKNDDPK